MAHLLRNEGNRNKMYNKSNQQTDAEQISAEHRNVKTLQHPRSWPSRCSQLNHGDVHLFRGCSGDSKGVRVSFLSVAWMWYDVARCDTSNLKPEDLKVEKLQLVCEIAA